MSGASCPLCGAGQSLSEPELDLGCLSDARVGDLLGSNEAPHREEALSLGHLAATAPSALRDIDAKLADLQTAIDALRATREMVECQLQTAKIILHPMRTIPKEILREIFLWTIEPVRDTDSVLYGLDSLDPEDSSWVISQTCRRWREITLSFPEFWSFVRLRFLHYREDDIPHRRLLYRLGLYLERSQNRDLDVVLSGTEEGLTELSAMPVLELGMRRWSHVKLDVVPSVLEYMNGNMFSRLKFLRTESHFSGITPITASTFASTSTPSLRELAVDYCSIHQHTSLPWSQLTSFSCSLDSWNCLGVLGKLTSLEVLVINGAFLNPMRPGLGRIALPLLTSLTLLHLFSVDMHALLDHLDMPRLSHLKWQTHVSDDEISFPTSEQVTLSLQSLALHVPGMTTVNIQDLLVCLRLAKKIETLHVAMDLNSLVGVFEQMAVGADGDEGAILLPCLRVFSLESLLAAQRITTSI